MFFAGRVELHGLPHEHSDYTRLHAAMESRGFSRIIQGRDGNKWHLPPAEYCHNGTGNVDQIVEKARQAVNAIGRGDTSTIVFFECNNWNGLNMKKA